MDLSGTPGDILREARRIARKTHRPVLLMYSQGERIVSGHVDGSGFRTHSAIVSEREALALLDANAGRASLVLAEDLPQAIQRRGDQIIYARMKRK